ncbi:RNA polymerase sigma factor RpoH [Geothermobacter hydrogeniphilus]|uniref:RNA polymerase sigma factor n=1 Tax=Geothermobacter hydrogeniphilus TaxID=1969733 RepID=A0A1X0Y5Z0_9BACT|nr:RNA polymerase sigma factor RpoH [Geothermobacter hydrogeniphilus]ORJ60474.1 RNA polymerase subunit sigma-70 [Geothermobacter hydrogeniphilus]
MSDLALAVVSDNFEHYMAQVNRFELLTPEQEIDLARRYRDQGDLTAAERLVTGNLRFVVKIAYEYRNYGCKLLDLVQEGNIGLMLAVKKFDPDRGIRLISYAVWWIRAYIQNFIIKSWSLVKIGTTQAQKKLFFKLNQTREALKRLTGGSNSEEIAAELDVRTTEVEEMEQRMHARDASLDLKLVDGDDYSLMDSLADERANQEELLAERQEDEQRRKQVGEALSRLKPRERDIVAARLLDDPPLTLQELADRYGISRERVRQIEQNALKKMKEALQCLSPPTAA